MRAPYKDKEGEREAVAEDDQESLPLPSLNDARL